MLQVYVVVRNMLCVMGSVKKYIYAAVTDIIAEAIENRGVEIFSNMVRRRKLENVNRKTNFIKIQIKFVINVLNVVKSEIWNM